MLGHVSETCLDLTNLLWQDRQTLWLLLSSTVRPDRFLQSCLVDSTVVAFFPCSDFCEDPHHRRVTIYHAVSLLNSSVSHRRARCRCSTPYPSRLDARRLPRCTPVRRSPQHSPFLSQSGRVTRSGRRNEDRDRGLEPAAVHRFSDHFVTLWCERYGGPFSGPRSPLFGTVCSRSVFRAQMHSAATSVARDPPSPLRACVAEKERP